MGVQPVSNWIIGVAAFGLMLWIPLQLIAVSQGFVGGVGLGRTFRGGRPPRGGSGGAGGQSGEIERQRRQDWRRDRDRRW